MTKKVAAVAGCLGINGTHIVDLLLAQEDWEVIGFSRRKPGQQSKWLSNPRFKHVSVDLLNDEESKQKLSSSDFAEVTHLFFMAYVAVNDEEKLIEVNMKMFKNTLDNMDTYAKNLKKVILITGTKYYGVHLNKPFKTPSKEEDPRHPGINFYYNQIDYLVEAQKGKKWTYVDLRPHDIIGYAENGSAMNIGTTIAVYATLCKEKGWKFRYPGSVKAKNQLYDSSSAEMVSRVMLWASDESNKAADNQSFNTVNVDVFRWVHMWPKLANYFGLEVDHDQKEPFNLAENLKDASSDWDAIVAKYKLKPHKLEDLATWGFADWVMSREYDAITDSNKLYEAGFTERVNTEKEYIKVFEKMKADNAIPKEFTTGK